VELRCVPQDISVAIGKFTHCCRVSEGEVHLRLKENEALVLTYSKGEEVSDGLHFEF